MRGGTSRETLQAARATYRTDPGIAFALGTTLYKKGAFRQTAHDLEDYLSERSQVSSPRSFMGELATDAFRIRYLLGSARYVLGRYKDAEDDARAVIALCPAFGDAWLLRADAVAAQGKDDELRAVLGEVDAGAGGDVLRALLDASFKARSGDRPGAIAIVAASLERHRAHPFLERAKQRLEAFTPHVAAHLLSSPVLPG